MMREMSENELLTRYMVGRYRLGHETVALYLAGILFEGLINRKLESHQKWSEEDLEQTTLEKKINEINDLTLKNDALFVQRKIFQRYSYMDRNGLQIRGFSNLDIERIRNVRSRLHNFRWLRNQIMHGRLAELRDDKDQKKEDLITYLWCEWAPESFAKALSKCVEQANVIDSLFEHTADYMVRAIDEVEAKDNDQKKGDDLRSAKISVLDFDNLFDLRRRLVPLKNYLGKWLPKYADFLQTDILTTIDTTSSYIWLPLVSKQKMTGEKRASVFDCSVSILATPLDLRVYMDFGGYNREQRKLYYNFLDGSPEYNSFYNQFQSVPGLEVFDVDWYSFIFNRRQMSVWLSQRESALNAARKKINAAPKAENSPITWNRCLHGFVFSKFDLPEGHLIDFDMIKQPLLDVIEFYKAFDRYKNRIGKESGRG